MPDPARIVRVISLENTGRASPHLEDIVSLSLQVKQFINSEHTGSYAEVTLPGVLPERPQKNAEEQPQEARHETAKFHYMEEGSGEPLLLIHSAGQSLYTWRKVFPKLSEYYRVIAVDLLGHGYSSRPESFDYTVEEHAESLALFLDAIGVESAHIMAFSMGAMYALALAKKYPERVGRMVLLTPGGLTPDMPLLVRMLDSTVFGPVACRLYGYKSVQKLLEECFFDLTNINDDMVNEYYRPASDPDGRTAVRLTIHNFDEHDTVAALRDMAVEALILFGAEDKWHRAEDINLIHSALPNAKSAQLRNAGHLMHEEKADKVVSAVLEFIPVVMP